VAYCISRPLHFFRVHSHLALHQRGRRRRSPARRTRTVARPGVIVHRRCETRTGRIGAAECVRILCARNDHWCVTEHCDYCEYSSDSFVPRYIVLLRFLTGRCLSIHPTSYLSRTHRVVATAAGARHLCALRIPCRIRGR
jgi:hypothetical protein